MGRAVRDDELAPTIPIYVIVDANEVARSTVTGVEEVDDVLRRS
jgi:hypothetical protein